MSYPLSHVSRLILSLNIYFCLFYFKNYCVIVYSVRSTNCCVGPSKAADCLRLQRYFDEPENSNCNVYGNSCRIVVGTLYTLLIFKGVVTKLVCLSPTVANESDILTWLVGGLTFDPITG